MSNNQKSGASQTPDYKQYEQYDFYETTLPLLKPRGRKITTLYYKILEKFIDSDMKTVIIQLDQKNKDKTYQGLLKAIRDHNITNIKVHFRENQIYLIRNEVKDND
jgi:hemoglobin-like flavoprotein